MSLCFNFPPRTGEGTLARRLIENPSVRAFKLVEKKRVVLQGEELEEHLAMLRQHRAMERMKEQFTLVSLSLFFFFAFFLVKKTSGILFFGPSFHKPARKASLGEIYLKNEDLYATDL